MSAIRDPAYITNAGRTMITAGGDISYTKAILYGQDISHLEKAQIEALTTIGNPLLEVKVGISDKKNTDNQTTVVLESTFQNSNLKSDLPYTAVGFFAKKGNDEEKLVLVAVANAGAYLSATRPDGVATDALDLKVAITIGDAANVTAVVDPSGSVTPATLSGAITKTTQDLTALIDTKADKQTVDDEISKIDFTPYAKTADIDQKLEAYDKITDVDDKIKKVTDLANSKVDATYSYSKDELDKKLLALSTDTNGKIDAAQVADMINGKANTNDVYNKKEVDDAFSLRDQKIDTKADKSTTYTKLDIDKALKSIDFGKIGIKENHLHVNTSEDSSDLQFNVAQRTIFPVKQSDGNWIFDRASDDVTAETAKEALEQVLQNGKTLNHLNEQFNTKADKDDVDKALKSIDFGKIGIKGKYLADVNGTLKDKIWYPAKQTDGSWTFNIYDDDHTAEVASNALSKAESNEGGINNLNSRFDKYAGNQTVKNADANAITTSGTYFVDSPGNNFPIDHWGVLVVHQANEDGNIRLEQIYYSDDNSLPWFRMKFNDNWQSWHQVASKEDINDLLNKLNQQSQQIQLLTTQLNNAKNEINYIKQNYVEGKRFAPNQEDQAKAWESQNSQRIAFISD